jgi:antitoxin YefM
VVTVATDIGISKSLLKISPTVEIISKTGSAVLISLDDYRALEETAYLLRSPANARRLMDSVEHARLGDVEARDLIR